MKKYVLIIVVLFIATSCSTQKAWNSPFINSEDIIKLEFGMSKTKVLDAMPEPPLYVESGDSETSVWVYNVRTIKVKSASNSDGTVTPRKTFKEKKHQGQIDNLYLTFDINDRLLAWGSEPYDSDAKEVYYDCAGVCNGDAVLDECGECIGGTSNSASDSKGSGGNANNDGGSFKLELNVEGTQEPDGTLTIKGGK